jgi:hypothetical protein
MCALGSWQSAAVGSQCQAADVDLEAPAVGKFQFDRNPFLERWSVVADVHLSGAGSGNAGGISRLLGLLLEILDNVDGIVSPGLLGVITGSFIIPDIFAPIL